MVTHISPAGDSETMSESGKKTTTVISCTTFETIKVSDPVVFYEADRSHIIYMSRDGDDRKDFYDGLVKDIEEQILSRRDTKIFLHNSVVYRYGEMLRLVNDIIRQEREEFGNFVDIYVNISSGSSEYAAAAMCACMMNPGTIPFTVRVKEHNVPIDKFRELIEEGAPFGDAKSVYRPRMVETFSIDPPPEEFVKYLAFFASIDGEPYTNVSIMNMMGEAGVWRYDPGEGGKAKQAAAMQFRRNVLEPLIDRGWIEGGRTKNRWNVTASGHAILDIFCDPEEIRSYAEIVESMRRVRYSICRSVCDMMEIPFREERP